jgi:hypothetical protein
MRNLEVLISAGAVLIAHLIIQAVQWLHERAEGQDPVRKMDNGRPEVLESI